MEDIQGGGRHQCSSQMQWLVKTTLWEKTGEDDNWSPTYGESKVASSWNTDDESNSAALHMSAKE